MDASLQTVFALTAAGASALVAATWQGTVLATAILLGLRLVPAATAAVRSLLWSGAFLLVVLLHVTPFLVHSGWNGSGGPAAHGLLRVGPLWALGIGCLWLGLTCCRAWRLGRSAARLRRIARQATPVSAEVIHSAEMQARPRSHSRQNARGVRLYTSTEIDRPCVIGLSSPRILLPPTLLATLSAPELEHVLLHELEHLRRADHWTNLAQKLVLVLFPLNPVLLWMERRLCTERELACDDGVLRQTHAHKAYARCLARLAEHSLVARGASLALGAWERQSELSRRIYRILLQQPESPVCTRRTVAAAGLLFLGLTAGLLELSEVPSIISFASAPAQRSPASLGRRPEAQAESALAQARMVDAVWSQPEVRRTVLERAARRRKPEPRITTGRSLQVASPVQPLIHLAATHQVRSTEMVLTRWNLIQHRDTRRQKAQPRLLRVSGAQNTLWPAYAVIPVADGWLIFPLNYPLNYPRNTQL